MEATGEAASLPLRAQKRSCDRAGHAGAYGHLRHVAAVELWRDSRLHRGKSTTAREIERRLADIGSPADSFVSPRQRTDVGSLLLNRAGARDVEGNFLLLDAVDSYRTLARH